MFELYLIRHAVAEERGPEWPDDGKRPLTEEGMGRMKKAAKGLKRLDVRFDVVLSSPLTRARQTAEVVAGVFDEKPPLVLVTSLAPGARYSELLTDLQKQVRRTRLALIGHEPDLGRLAARLAGSRRAFEFKKGAVCRIDVDALPPERSGILRWFLPPSILRSIS